MSRGYKNISGFSARESKSFSASESNAEGKRIPAPLLEKAIAAIQDNEVVKNKLSDLAEAISFQQSYSQTENLQSRVKSNADIKANKQKIVSILKSLPDDVRRAIELPKSAIDGLYRGVKDRLITEKGEWKNGSFVYGFTADKGMAKKFEQAWKANDFDDARIISGKDIESFGGLLDVQKVPELLFAFNDAQVARYIPDKAFEGMFTTIEMGDRDGLTKEEKKNIPKMMKAGITGIFDLNNDIAKYSKEREILAYDLKFKRSSKGFYSDK